MTDSVLRMVPLQLTDATANISDNWQLATYINRGSAVPFGTHLTGIILFRVHDEIIPYDSCISASALSPAASSANIRSPSLSSSEAPSYCANSSNTSPAEVQEHKQTAVLSDNRSTVSCVSDLSLIKQYSVPNDLQGMCNALLHPV